MRRARDATFQSPLDSERAQSLQLERIQQEIAWLEQSVIPPNANVAFCHNDVLAANILLLDNKKDIQLIDFEYGGVNFCAFDIANHFNEHAGGTDTGVPNYNWFPTPKVQEDFITEYLEACGNNNTTTTMMSVSEMSTLVQAFVMVNHLYWALWAVNQASTEGCSGFDYLLYSSHRIGQYYKCKAARCE
jgi:ethanolamine kinase